MTTVLYTLSFFRRLSPCGSHTFLQSIPKAVLGLEMFASTSLSTSTFLDKVLPRFLCLQFAASGP